MTNYFFDAGKFVIEGFDEGKPFASFLPGLAGLKGIPMWTFYVNRGQGISSFGVRDKNSPIMEFSPANISYKNVADTGFRTFIKIKGKQEIYEPFQSARPDSEAKRTMTILSNGLTIEESHAGHGLKTMIHYFNLPNDDYAALVRRIEIVNIGEQDIEFELLDGLPEILPFGVENSGYKEIGNLLRSWMEVYNLENGIPFYKLRSSTNDDAQVSEITSGHFYLSFTSDGGRIAPIVDFEVVFGANTSLAYPDRFGQMPLSELVELPQYPVNKVPCGFSGVARTLSSGCSLTLNTLIGHVNDIDKINQKAHSLCTETYISNKMHEAASLTGELTADIATHTSSPLFDAYCQQSYLDNFLRGGYPFIFDNGADGSVVHLYSRKHGDMERDYNFFSLAPEYYSQGNGNFRDMNQNRRNDVFFNPKVGSFNIKMFYSLIQADGYNPLSVQGTSFEVKAEHKDRLKAWLKETAPDHYEKLGKLCSGKFTPGRLINYIADHNITLAVSEDEFLTYILSQSQQNIEASFGEGFWSDHWTYNLDLVEGYLDIFPDKRQELLFGDESYAFYDSPAYVQPRSEKYVLNGDKVRQYGALLEDEEKLHKLQRKAGDTHWLRVNGGHGDIYRNNLFVKMFSLTLNKFATLDPYGMGVEMEGNKPGWNDAMNGLPGLFGSGMSETFELKRNVVFLLELLADRKNAEKTVELPVEMFQFLESVNNSVISVLDGELTQFRYWDAVTTAREAYRQSIRFGITGLQSVVSLEDLRRMLTRFLAKIEVGINQAVELGNGLVPTYFRFEASKFYPVTDDDGNSVISAYGLPKAVVEEFEVFALPYFLEGPTRWLKTLNDREQARSVYNSIKKTGLYDPQTSMYQTSVSLDGESHEIGRMRAFTPGWLERESNFLHMSYKYLLELLKAGLYDEFYGELKTSLVPFLDPAVYGRSTLENSSFIATGGNPDPGVHGRGFVARLSGSTAEFLSMWRVMMAGKKAFSMVEGELALSLAPALPGWLFDEQGTLSFTFLGRTEVTYYNPRRANTFGENKAVIKSLMLVYQDGTVVEVASSLLSGGHAEALRRGEIKAIKVVLE
ncbi:MAG: cellobiose phosphorylase [Paenibacillus sp.]|nr:cellobiose phosphorylase [Paenibacillus sp.]